MSAVLSTLASALETHRSSADQFLRDPRSPKIMEFADWALTENASVIWQKIFSDSINGSGRRDFQFIFHLGDVAGKKVFEIDEVLDIIGDYSSYGKVSLILDTREADTLWCRLNGRGAESIVSGPASTGAAKRYLFIFNTMRIDYLAVVQGSSIMHFSHDGQIQLASPSPVSILGIVNARTRFSIGCQLGVLLGQDCPHSVALGLAVSGAWSTPVSAPDATALLDYMKEWQKRIY